MHFASPPWDIDFLFLINEAWTAPALDALMLAVSAWWGLWGAALLLVLVMPPRRPFRRFTLILVIALAAGCCDFSTNVLKHHFDRVRPLNVHPGIRHHQDGEWRLRPQDFTQTKERGTSYPSAHAAASMAAATAIFFAAARRRRLVFALPLLVGWSRVYLGKHYPSDVVAGWLWGMMVAWGFSLAAETLLAKRRRSLSRDSQGTADAPAIPEKTADP